MSPRRTLRHELSCLSASYQLHSVRKQQYNNYKCPSGAVLCKSGSTEELSMEFVAKDKNVKTIPLNFLWEFY